MTVKELIEKLEEYSGNMEVWIVDHAEGNDHILQCVESGLSQYDSYNQDSKPYKVLYLG
jgi:Uma2 family endonuclease